MRGHLCDSTAFLSSALIGIFRSLFDAGSVAWSVARFGRQFHVLLVKRRLDLKTYRMGEGVIGPRDNVFRGPAVALDGPAKLVHNIVTVIIEF